MPFPFVLLFALLLSKPVQRRVCVFRLLLFLTFFAFFDNKKSIFTRERERERRMRKGNAQIKVNHKQQQRQQAHSQVQISDNKYLYASK